MNIKVDRTVVVTLTEADLVLFDRMCAFAKFYAEDLEAKAREEDKKDMRIETAQGIIKFVTTLHESIN